ncbi:MAG: aspartate--tRNA(Asn) ligase [Clostridiaceae bacterium]|nr:aspartate--tRNA(Asn) ligase [Clostridiaceae bacterium]
MLIIQPQSAEYSIEASALSLSIGETVTLQGMVYKIREMSGFAFILLQTRTQLCQCVWSPDFTDFPLSALHPGAAVRVKGAVTEEPRSHTGYELRLLSCTLLNSPSREEPPVVINNREATAALDTLLDYRPLTLRNQKERAIFVIQAALCAGFRRFFIENGFTEIHSPKLCSGGAEGGTEVFQVDYFGKPACLAQSPQLYKQMMVGVFERVYEIAPVFRAEKHDTARHINEYTGVDFEMGFITSFHDLMRMEARLIASALSYVDSVCPEELALLKTELPKTDAIPAIPFDEAKLIIADAYHRPVTDPLDFDPEEEKLLGALIKQETGSDFVFVTHYKSAKRPFYTMDTPGNPDVTESFDLLFRGMEVTTGGQRIHDYDMQLDKMRARGVDPALFESYLSAHKYGLPPHGGLGIGLERFTARLLGFDNVRRATLFPRDTHRLEP